MQRLAVVVGVMLVVLAAPAAAQLPPTIQQLLDKPELKPFVTKVISLQSCLTDKNLVYFDVQQCPSLLRMLEALSLNNTNPPVSCEKSCIMQFSKLSESCFGNITASFQSDKTNIGRLATEFFAACQDLLNPNKPAPAPAPQPSPSPEQPTPSPSPSASPSPSPAATTDGTTGESPAPSVPAAGAPAPSPASGADALPKALLSLLSIAAAALLLLH